MRYRLFAGIFALCLAAWAQTLSVDKLYSFVQNELQFIKDGKSTDKELADFLAKTKLSERLDDRSIEQMQSLGVGPKTLAALRRLGEQSQSLPAAKPIEPPSPPAQAPPPSSEEQAAIIDAVRAYALAYSQNLPDFICTQVTRRFAAPKPGTRYGGREDGEPSWQLQDTLTIRLSFFEQKEDYKVIMQNDNIVSQDYNTLGGSTTRGDFGSMTKAIFERGTQAHFQWDHWGTLRSQLVMVFAYRVDQARSQWQIVTGAKRELQIVPAYHGLVYVVPQTNEIVRVTLEAENVPPSFPVKMAQTILDYGYADLSGQPFLLPLKGQTLMAADDYVSRNDTEFRLYRKYSAESVLKFDTDTPAPLPEDQTKETPAAPPAKNQKKKK